MFIWGKMKKKPKNEEDAVELLMMLAGKEHTVKTGFSVVRKSDDVSVSQVVTTSSKP